MHYGVRADRIPVMRNYSDALIRLGNIKPYSKGKYKGEKPLAERNRQYLRVRQGEQGEVVVTMYQTDIITFVPDGRILIDQNTYNTPTTHHIIARILDSYLLIRYKVGWIKCSAGFLPLRHKGFNTFTRGAGGELEFANPIYPKTHQLRKKDFNKLRKNYSEFITYALGLVKLSGSCAFDAEASRAEFGEIVKIHMFSPHEITLMMQSGTEMSTWYKAFLILTSKCSYKPRSPVAEMRKQIDLVLKYAHHREVFDTKEIRDGRIVRDSNQDFFPSVLTHG